MADTILIKRDSTPGLAPSTSQLALGELAMNTHDGKIYMKKNDGADAVIEVGFPVPTGGVATSSIEDAAVTSIKINDGAVLNAKLGASSVTSDKIANGAVGTSELEDGSISTIKIAASAVTSNELGTSSVIAAKLAANAVTTTKINGLAVTTAKIAANAVTSAKVDGTVATQTATTGTLDLPSGTDAQRDTGTGIGGLRWSTTNAALEAYNGTDWTLYKSANGVNVDSTGIYMSGSYTGSFTATGDITAYSDARLKTDWAGFSDDILLRATTIQYGTFTRNDIEENTRHIGVTAQSLQKVFPEAVRENKDGILSVNYGPAALSLVLALNEKVLELEQQIKELKDK